MSHEIYSGYWEVSIAVPTVSYDGNCERKICEEITHKIFHQYPDHEDLMEFINEVIEIDCLGLKFGELKVKVDIRQVLVEINIDDQQEIVFAP